MKSHKLIIFKYSQHILPRILLPFFRSGSQSILSVIGYPYFGLKVSVWCLWFATWIFYCLPAYPSIDWLPVLWSGSQSFQAMICFLSVVWKLVFPACNLLHLYFGLEFSLSSLRLDSCILVWKSAFPVCFWLPVFGLEISLSCLWLAVPVFWSGSQISQVAGEVFTVPGSPPGQPENMFSWVISTNFRKDSAKFSINIQNYASLDPKYSERIKIFFVNHQIFILLS